MSLIATAVVASPALATFPRKNGPILFRDDHPSSGVGYPLFLAHSDGTHVRFLSNQPGLFSDWRPDGRRFAFDFFRPNGSEQIATMRPDGGDLKVITSGKGIHEVPSYSPDGTEILFMCDNNGTLPHLPSDFNQDICVMHANGSNIVHVIDTPNVLENWPSWGPASH